MTTKLKVAVCLCSIAVFALFCLSNACYGQEQKLENKSGFLNEEDCMKNFSLEKADMKNPKLNDSKKLLVNYVQCKAAMKNNASVCSTLNAYMPAESITSETQRCMENFNMHQTFYTLMKSGGTMSKPQLDLCMQSRGMTREACVAEGKAFYSGDDSVCTDIKDPKMKANCRATVNGDPNLCSDDKCRSQAQFIKALRSGSEKECDNLKSNEAMKLTCKACATENQDACEQDKGYQEFKSKYCKMFFITQDINQEENQ